MQVIWIKKMMYCILECNERGRKWEKEGGSRTRHAWNAYTLFDHSVQTEFQRCNCSVYCIVNIQYSIFLSPRHWCAARLTPHLFHHFWYLVCMQISISYFFDPSRIKKKKTNLNGTHVKRDTTIEFTFIDKNLYFIYASVYRTSGDHLEISIIFIIQFISKYGAEPTEKKWRIFQHYNWNSLNTSYQYAETISHCQSHSE